MVYTKYEGNYQQKSIKCDSGFLICGLMMKTLYQQSMEKIDITEIKSAISTLNQYSPKNQN